MFKQFLSVVLSFSLACNTAYAQPAKTPPASSIPSPDPDPEEKARIAPLFPGDPAPFTGVLFSTRATATVLAEIESFDDKLAIEVQKVQRDADARKKFELSELDAKRTREKEVVKSELDSQTKVNERLKSDLKKAQDDLANAPNRLVWASLGVAGGVLVTVLITFAVNQVSK